MQSRLEPKDYVRQVEEKAAWAGKQEDIARERLARVEHIREFWDSLSRYVSGGHDASVLLVLRKEASYLRDLRESRDPIGPVLAEIREQAEQRARDLAATFVRAFPEAIRQAGLQIDATSRHPVYTFKQGFIRVEADDREFTAKLLPRDGEQALLGIDVGPLVDRLQNEITRIFDREFQPEVLLKSLYTAYLAALRADARPEGDEVPLRRVTSRLAKNLNRFAYDEFNIDLSRLIQSGNLVIDDRRAHFNHTRNARQGMLLHGLEQGGYVGFISFKREGLP